MPAAGAARARHQCAADDDGGEREAGLVGQGRASDEEQRGGGRGEARSQSSIGAEQEADDRRAPEPDGEAGLDET